MIGSSPARPEGSRYHRTEKQLVTSTLIDRLEHNRNCALSNGPDKRERTKRNEHEKGNLTIVSTVLLIGLNSKFYEIFAK